MNNLRTYLLAALVGLLFTLPTQSVFADYDQDSDCPGESCDNPGNGPPGGDSISEAQAEAIAKAVARAISRSTSRSSSKSGAEASNELNFEGTDGDRFPGTSASVYASRCGGGASVSYPGGAAAITANDKFCNRMDLAAFYAVVLDDKVTAKLIVEDAHDRLNRSGRLFGIPRFLHLDEIPVLGPILFGN